MASAQREPAVGVSTSVHRLKLTLYRSDISRITLSNMNDLILPYTAVDEFTCSMHCRGQVVLRCQREVAVSVVKPIGHRSGADRMPRQSRQWWSSWGDCDT